MSEMSQSSHMKKVEKKYLGDIREINANFEAFKKQTMS
jgi:hypothetical protein